jgi:RNA polymerase sigma factor (TIGR02999 family)
MDITSMNENQDKFVRMLQTGSPNDLVKFAPMVINELHRLAQKHMFREDKAHTLQATALVNEVYIRMSGADADWQNRAHFFAMAANHMRRILVDHARSKKTQRRIAQSKAISTEDEVVIDEENSTSLVLLDEVLTQLSLFDQRASDMYEMRLFAGLSNEDISKVCEVSVTTVERDIKVAKAWVSQKMADG